MNTASHLKTIIAAALLLAGASVCHAQEIVSGSLLDLKAAEKAKIEIDFSKAIIMDMSEKSFAKYEEDWTKDNPEIVINFVKGMNSQVNRFLNIGYDIEVDLTIKIEVENINDRGDWECTAMVINKDEQVLCEIEGLHGFGNNLGTKLWRIKSGAYNTGSVLGYFLYRKMKKLKHQ
jgi:hypothetical protein